MAGRTRDRRSGRYQAAPEGPTGPLHVRERAPRRYLIPYRVLAGDSAARPFVLCSLGRSTAHPIAALVDSGADSSSLPSDVARRLGVSYDASQARVAFGAGGEFTQHEAAGNVVLETEIGPVTLTRPSISDVLPFILFGRRDIFAGRVVCFDQDAQQLRIEAR
ncbi:MAG: aspartyl protease family protein [Chloroflexi bacterium]|nr:aspartyl protease family protein [Chloroflexota bacterium]